MAAYLLSVISQIFSKMLDPPAGALPWTTFLPRAPVSPPPLANSWLRPWLVTVWLLGCFYCLRHLYLVEVSLNSTVISCKIRKKWKPNTSNVRLPAHKIRPSELNRASLASDAWKGIQTKRKFLSGDFQSLSHWRPPSQRSFHQRLMCVHDWLTFRS